MRAWEPGSLDGAGLRRLGALAPATALVTVALDLARQILRDEVDRVDHVVGALPGAERHALHVKRDLGDLRLPDRGVALLLEPDLHLSQRRNLTRHLPELGLDPL